MGEWFGYTTFGGTHSASYNNLCYANTEYPAPYDGILTKFRTNLGQAAGQLKLKVLRYVNYQNYHVIGESQLITAEVGLKEYDITNPILVQEGDLIGYYLTNPSGCKNIRLQGSVVVINGDIPICNTSGWTWSSPAMPCVAAYIVSSSPVDFHVRSDPLSSGIEFELDGVPYTTPWDGTITPVINHTIEMISPCDVGGVRYLFKKWHDENTDNPRTFSIESETTFTMYMDRQFKLTVISDPAGVDFTYDGNSETTPYTSDWTDENTVITLVMPEQWGTQFFGTWEIQDFNETRDVTINSNKTVTGYYKDDEGEGVGIVAEVNKPVCSISVLYSESGTEQDKWEEEDGGQTADSGSVVHGYSIRFAEKVFFCKGLWWVFYVNNNSKLVYVTSPDGITWTNAIEIRTCNYQYGETMGVRWDGTYLHFAVKKTNWVYYRRATPNTNGTLTWDGDDWYEAFYLTTAYKADHHLCLDSEGYPYLSWHGGPAPVALQVKITKSTTKDGSWTTASGYPKNLADGHACSMVARLPNQDMIVIYCKASGSAKAYSRKWNQSTTTWESEVQATVNNPCSQNAGVETWSWDIVKDNNGDLHFVYLDTSYNIRYRKYSHETSTWGTEVTIVASTSKHASPQLAIDTICNKLILFWCGSPTEHHIYYKIYDIDDDSWGDTVDWLNEETDQLRWGDEDVGDDGVLNASYEILSRRIGVAYITKTAGSTPAKLKFAFMKLTYGNKPCSVVVSEVHGSA